MYKLSCSDLNNSRAIELIFSEKEKAEKVREQASIDKIIYFIFNETIDEKMYKIITVSLTLGDELEEAIDERIAKVLFFALCVNSNNRIDMRIKNLTQASTLYELYSNDYNKIEVINNDNLEFATFEIYHNLLFKDSIIWSIPVEFFWANNKKNVILAGINHCFMKINDVEYRVPRMIFIKFFKDSMIKGLIVCDDIEGIKEKFNAENTDILYNTFENIGYHRRREFQDIEMLSIHFYVEDNKFYCIDKGRTIIDDNLWSPISEDGKYILLKNIEYILTKSNQEYCISLLAQ